MTKNNQYYWLDNFCIGADGLLFAADSIADDLEDVAVDVDDGEIVCVEEDNGRRGGAVEGKVMAILV